jgi:hypothetical protein
VQRAPLHPLEHFRAFQVLSEKGQSEEEIAAAFFVPAPPVIKICMAAFIRSLAAVLSLCQGDCRGASCLPRKVSWGPPASVPMSPVMNTFAFHNRLFVLTLI